MKVILLQDVARVGRRFDVAEVPSGHALNYLIPRKLALPATPESLKRVEAQKQKQAERSALAGQQFDEALLKLSKMNVELPAEANEQGHLFRGIKAEDIAGILSEMGIALVASQIVLDAPIKEVGEHAIKAVSGEKEGNFTLTVVAK